MTDDDRKLIADLAQVVREYRDLIVAGEKLPDGKIPDRRIRIEVRGLDRLLRRAAEVTR